MNPAYFETHFRTEPEVNDWPAAFAILTGYATTGEVWTDQANQAADRALEEELCGTAAWLRRITGYSPKTDHCEPGWAVEIGLDAAIDIGRRFRQDALYYVTGDSLRVTSCNSGPSQSQLVGGFRERISRSADR